MGSILAVLGGLWFVGAAVLNVAGGGELLSFPRVLYIGLAMIAFAHVPWSELIDQAAITAIPDDRERPPED